MSTPSSSVHKVLPQAQVMQLDTQANVIQALEAGRVDAAAVDLSTVRWLAKRAARQVRRRRQAAGTRCSTARRVRQGDLDWLHFVNTTFNVAMFGHQNEIFDKAVARLLRPEAAGADARPAQVLIRRVRSHRGGGSEDG